MGSPSQSRRTDTAGNRRTSRSAKHPGPRRRSVGRGQRGGFNGHLGTAGAGNYATVDKLADGRDGGDPSDAAGAERSAQLGPERAECRAQWSCEWRLTNCARRRNESSTLAECEPADPIEQQRVDLGHRQANGAESYSDLVQFQYRQNYATLFRSECRHGVGWEQHVGRVEPYPRPVGSAEPGECPFVDRELS